MSGVVNKEGRREAAYVQPDKDAAANISAPSDLLPFVSVIIPCYNEERFIGKVLENLLAQYDLERFEVVIVDGMSEDRTREVVNQFISEHNSAQIRLVDNPQRNIPTALNRGIANARGEIIVRMDAHSIPSTNYVRRAVEVLREGEAAIVGMPWRITASRDTVSARAIALAVSHRFGIGDAKYRLKAHKPEFVDTVPFGAFHKSLWQELDGFNEQLLANEDYDFFYRTRSLGKRILLDPTEHSIYFARPTLKDLAIQYARYGNWKAQMLKMHPRSIKLRQMIAPAFVLSILFLSLLGAFWSPALWLLLAILVAYAGLAILSAFQQTRTENQQAGKENGLVLVGLIAIVFTVIHIAWGSSFLLSMLRPSR